MNAEIKERIEMINKGKVPEGYKETKEWKKYKFDDIAILSNKKYYPKDDVRNYRCIELEHIEQETGRINGWSNSTEQKSAKTYFKSGDILYGKLRPYLRKYYLAEFNGVCSTEIWVINSKTNFVDNGYLFYLIQTEKFNNAANISTGTRMPRADWRYIKNTIFKIPPLPEQQKIAQILFTWDQAIELKEKLIEEKKEQKKGLMQKLLTGEVRLPGFDGQWEKVRLGKVLFFPKKEALLNPQDYYLLTVKLHLNGIEATDKKPNKTKRGRPYYMREPKELLIGRQNFHNGGIGIVPDEMENYIASNAISTLQAKKGDIKFYYYYLSNANFYKRIGHIVGGTGQKEISETEMKKLKLIIPKSLQEQKAIAKILSTADKEIELLNQELEQLKLQKKGLMQLLLTGIIRVKS